MYKWARENCEELILEKVYENIPEHSRIVCVEGMSIQEVVEVLAERIPHENLYLVKSRMVQYPYQNYHLFSKMNLKRLFGYKESYTVTFAVDGKLKEKDIPLVYYDGFLEFIPDDEFLTYEIFY